jgi:hypothetical protein
MTKKHKLTTTEKLQHNVNALAFLEGAIMGMMILGNFLRQMESHNFEVSQYWQSVEAPQPLG